MSLGSCMLHWCECLRVVLACESLHVWIVIFVFFIFFIFIFFFPFFFFFSSKREQLYHALGLYHVNIAVKYGTRVMHAILTCRQTRVDLSCAEMTPSWRAGLLCVEIIPGWHTCQRRKPSHLKRSLPWTVMSSIGYTKKLLSLFWWFIIILFFIFVVVVVVIYIDIWLWS